MAHSTLEQIKFMNEWFETWSEFQKEDFVTIFAQKLRPSQFINGLVNGLQSMNCSSRPASLFSCQTKLFGEWWDSWSEEDRENFKTKLRANDAKFWIELEGELDGTRKKLDEDFFLVSNSVAAATPIVPPAVNVAVAVVGESNAIGDTTEVQSSLLNICNKESNMANGSGDGEVHIDKGETEIQLPHTMTMVIEGGGDV